MNRNLPLHFSTVSAKSGRALHTIRRSTLPTSNMSMDTLQGKVLRQIVKCFLIIFRETAFFKYMNYFWLLGFFLHSESTVRPFCSNEILQQDLSWEFSKDFVEWLYVFIN